MKIWCEECKGMQWIENNRCPFCKGEGYKCEHAHCCTLSNKYNFGVYALKCERLLKSEEK